ncbi:MAG: hypothetical protein AAGA35_02925 [Patescibacteria group bacterium]
MTDNPIPFFVFSHHAKPVPPPKANKDKRLAIVSVVSGGFQVTTIKISPCADGELVERILISRRSSDSLLKLMQSVEDLRYNGNGEYPLDGWFVAEEIAEDFREAHAQIKDAVPIGDMTKVTELSWPTAV